MKKILYILTMLAILFALAGCSKTTTGQTAQTGTSASLSTATELLVGTFKLETTDQAVTSDQAKKLLPLWQMLQSLSTSSTSATEEMQAVVDQIQSTMTSSQMDQISSMNLTQPDVMALMTQNMTSANASGASSTPLAINGLPGDSSTTGGMPSGGGVPPTGGMPSGAPSGGMPAGGNMPSGSFPSGGSDTGVAGASGLSTTPQAVRSNGMADQLPEPLLKALIELLQKKVQP